MIPEWMDLVVWGHEHECQVGVRARGEGRDRSPCTPLSLGRP